MVTKRSFTIEDRLKVIRANSKRTYAIRKNFLRAYKSERGCGECGEKDSICLEFHHRNPKEKNKSLYSKEKNGIKGSWMRLNMEALLKELPKVEVLCANCHRKKHGDDKEPFMRNQIRENRLNEGLDDEGNEIQFSLFGKRGTF